MLLGGNEIIFDRYLNIVILKQTTNSYIQFIIAQYTLNLSNETTTAILFGLATNSIFSGMTIDI